MRHHHRLRHPGAGELPRLIVGSIIVGGATALALYAIVYVAAAGVTAAILGSVR